MTRSQLINLGKNIRDMSEAGVIIEQYPSPDHVSYHSNPDPVHFTDDG